MPQIRAVISVGGYVQSGTRGSTNITIVNNSLYDNDTQKTGSGEFQIQYRATGILFENNIVYAGAQGLFLHGFVSGSGVTGQLQRLLQRPARLQRLS